jgi:hypothetical protein
MSRPDLAVAFGILCCISIALVIASLWLGADGAAAILAVGFAAAFAGLVGCGP